MSIVRIYNILHRFLGSFSMQKPSIPKEKNHSRTETRRLNGEKRKNKKDSVAVRKNSQLRCSLLDSGHAGCDHARILRNGYVVAQRKDGQIASCKIAVAARGSRLVLQMVDRVPVRQIGFVKCIDGQIRTFVGNVIKVLRSIDRRGEQNVLGSNEAVRAVRIIVFGETLGGILVLRRLLASAKEMIDLVLVIIFL